MATRTNIDDSIIAETFLEVFREAMAPISRFANRWESELTIGRGSQVVVPIISSLTATTAVNNYTIGGGANTVVTVDIDKHFVAPVSVSDRDVAASVFMDIMKFVPAAAHAVSKAFIQDVWSVLTTGSFGSAVVDTAAASFVSTDIVTVRNEMNSNDVPMNDRSLFLDPDFMTQLLKDENFRYANRAGSTESLREGRVDRAYGFDIFESNLIPLNSISLVGFAAHRDAIAVVNRPVESQAAGEYLEAEIIQDSETGLAVYYRRHYDTNTGTHYVNFETDYGYSGALTHAAKLITKP